MYWTVATFDTSCKIFCSPIIYTELSDASELVRKFIAHSISQSIQLSVIQAINYLAVTP